MKDTTTQPTHAEIAKGLSVSRSYVSRLSRLGMPTNSLKAAKAWIQKRSEQIGTDHGSQQTLTEARREKIRLECEILTLRLEREREDVELVSVGEIQKFMQPYIAYAAVAFKVHAESLTNELVGLPEIEIYTKLREAFNKTLFLAALGYIKGAIGIDQRLVAHAEKCIHEQFGHFPAETKDALEEHFLALIRWANQQEGSK